MQLHKLNYVNYHEGYLRARSNKDRTHLLVFRFINVLLAELVQTKDPILLETKIRVYHSAIQIDKPDLSLFKHWLATIKRVY